MGVFILESRMVTEMGAVQTCVSEWVGLSEGIGLHAGMHPCLYFSKQFQSHPLI